MSILSDLANGVGPDKALDKATLLAAVQRSIFCAKSGDILDVRTAVLVVVTKGRSRGTQVLTGEVYDALKDSFESLAKSQNATLQIVDGRTL